MDINKYENYSYIAKSYLDDNVPLNTYIKFDMYNIEQKQVVHIVQITYNKIISFKDDLGNTYNTEELLSIKDYNNKILKLKIIV